ncbi:MAG: dihydropteroate synthase [Sandaracinaceae bacterium]|nr:dihydropteroate synthase [Sandaracinaceae bacterium]
MRGEPRAAGAPTTRAPARETSRGPRACEVWGVLNVTPDSFSDGGRYLHLDDAVRQAARMLEEGADVIDVGGESSRPPGVTYGAGYAPVSVDEERARVVPVVERLVRELGCRVSVDTVKPEVARAALDAGARIVNDVSGAPADALLDAVRDHGADLVVMHSRARGRVDAESTRYEDVVAEVRAELLREAERALARGVPPGSIWIDPGVGFAKTARQSAALLGGLDALVRTGYPVLVGASRKSFIAEAVVAAGGAPPPPDARLGGSLAAVVAAVTAGCRAVRVHDVFPSVQAARVTEAMR